MFAINVRVRPCSARSSPRSVGRVTVITLSECSIFIRAGTSWDSSPRGPLTITRPGESETFTPLGNSMGCLPIRLISLPDEAHDLAADAFLLCRTGRDQSSRSRQDRHAHPAEHARQTILARIDTAAGLRHPLEVGDDPLAAPAVLQLDDQGIEAFALLDVEVRDVSLLLEDAGNALLEAGGRHLGSLVQRLVGVADACEHVGDWIGQHRVTSSISSCRESRPDVRGPAGRSGTGRTCGTLRAGVRSGCTASSSAPGTSAAAAA